MSWPHYTKSPARLRTEIEYRLTTGDTIGAISLAYQNGFAFGDTDIATPTLARYDQLKSSGNTAGALDFKLRYGVLLEDERRVLTKLRSLTKAYSGETPQEKHAAETAKTRAADRERELAKQAEELIAEEDAAARATRIAKAREQIAKESSQ